MSTPSRTPQNTRFEKREHLSVWLSLGSAVTRLWVCADFRGIKGYKKVNEARYGGHTHKTSRSRGRGRRIMSLKPVWAKLVRPYLKKKINKNKRAGNMDQVVGYLFERHWLQSPVLKTKQERVW
jgi:hypothetical protein